MSCVELFCLGDQGKAMKWEWLIIPKMQPKMCVSEAADSHYCGILLYIYLEKCGNDLMEE